MGIEGDKKGRLARTVPVVRQTTKEACLQEANPTKKTEGPGSCGGDESGIGPGKRLGKWRLPGRSVNK